MNPPASPARGRRNRMFWSGKYGVHGSGAVEHFSNAVLVPMTL
jgi:hypothetical protein